MRVVVIYLLFNKLGLVIMLMMSLFFVILFRMVFMGGFVLLLGGVMGGGLGMSVVVGLGGSVRVLVGFIVYEICPP